MRGCPKCGSTDTHECSHAKMPYRCRDCRKYFSVKAATVMAGSPLPLLKWLYAIYLDCTHLKGVSSMKLHRDLGITQDAWFMQQRIREAFANRGRAVQRPGGSRRNPRWRIAQNMSNAQRKALQDTGRGSVGKTAVAGLKDSAE